MLAVAHGWERGVADVFVSYKSEWRAAARVYAVSVTTPMRLVLDTNVVVAAFRRPSGASAALLNGVRQGGATMVANAALFWNMRPS